MSTFNKSGHKTLFFIHKQQDKRFNPVKMKAIIIYQ